MKNEQMGALSSCTKFLHNTMPIFLMCPREITFPGENRVIWINCHIFTQST